MTDATLPDLVDGLVHEPTQVHEDGLDLTVTEIYEIEGPGRVDFGGGELEDAAIASHDRTWRNPDDDYQWWNLEQGIYLIEYNERLTGDGRVRLQTRDAVRERGAFHPTITVTHLERVPLNVAGAGLRIKENARVSTLVPNNW